MTLQVSCDASEQISPRSPDWFSKCPQLTEPSPSPTSRWSWNNSPHVSRAAVCLPTARSTSRNPRKPLCALLISSCLVSAVLSGDKDKEIHRLLLCCRGSFARNSNNSENLLQFGQARQRQWVTMWEKTRTGVVECISALPTSGKDNVILFSVNLDCIFLQAKCLATSLF